MKKLLVALVAVIFAGVVNVNAITKDDLIAKLSKNYSVGEKSVKIDESIITQIRQYINDEENNVTEAELNVMSEQFDIVLNYFIANPSELKEDLSQAAKDEILKAKDVLEKDARIAIEITDNGAVTATNTETNKVVVKAEDNDITIRDTGSNYVLVAIASLISVGGIAFVAKKVNE